MTNSPDDSQTPEEAELQVSSSTVGAAKLFLDAIVKHARFDVAQALMTPEMRLATAQDWVWANRDHEALEGRDLENLAVALSQGPDSGEDLWEDFAFVRCSVYVRELEDWWTRAGIASHPRPVGVDLELVMFVDTEEVNDSGGTEDTDFAPRTIREIELGSAIYVLMNTRVPGRELVAGHGEWPRVPQWPPVS